jgi:PAS domain S-box-containing protein
MPDVAMRGEMSERSPAETQARLAAIVESSEDAIISKDLDGIVESWNQAAERIFGYSEAEMLGKPIRLLIPSELQDEEDMILARIRAGQRVEHYETVRITKDRRRIDVSLSVSPLRDAAGRVVGASKIARDISERRRMERELAAQREWFRVTLSSVGDAVIASSVDGRVTFLNAVAEKLTGWRAEEAVGRPLPEVFCIISEQTREPIENPAQKVIQSGAILGLGNHTALIARDGSERPIADSAAPIFDDAGKVIGVVVTFQDIAAKRLADELRQEQREWFEQTLQGIGDGVIATDIRGHIVFMNRVAEELTGRTLGDSMHASCSDVYRVVDERTGEPSESPIGRVLREGQSAGLASPALLIGADGSERFIDEIGAPIRSSSGRLIGAVLVFRDVGERRRVELERLAVAQERERLLEGERAARSEAERANRVKDDFVATLSHELRTPLSAILGWAQIMRAQPSRPDLMQRGMEVIERNARMQTQLVSDLLDMSRISSGKLALEMRVVDLAVIVQAALETIQPAAQTKGVALEVDLDSALGPMAGDPARLQQVVWNLLSNAVKFTPAGGKVQVRLERSGAEATIAVRDTGIGIATEFLPSLFERFRQADSATNRRYGGLGLGLAIVKQLVELHGGTVEARSDGEGRGSTFRVRLPISELRLRGEEAIARSAERPQERVLPDERGLAELRVLVVEDDTDTADLLQRLLHEWGAHVTTVSSASAALETLAAREPHLLVSDIGMPGVDGYELIRTIRSLEPSRGGAIPAVAVTAFARPEDRARALLAGYQAHLSKPIDPAQLIGTMKMLAGLILTPRRSSPA